VPGGPTMAEGSPRGHGRRRHRRPPRPLLVNTSLSRSMQSRIRRSSTGSVPTPARALTSGPGAPQPTAPSSSSLNCPLAAVADQPGGHRGLDIPTRSCDPPPPARPPCAAPARPASSAASRISITATSRNATRLQITRPERLGSGRAAAPGRTTRRGPTTGNPGGPMKVARNGSDRSHDGGRRHDRGTAQSRSAKANPRGEGGADLGDQTPRGPPLGPDPVIGKLDPHQHAPFSAPGRGAAG
jgi:hypothetical protein